MNWIQPKFTDFNIPPAKKQKTTKANVKKIKNIENQLENITWLNKVKPKKKTDLIVNKKKIEEVESWLDDTKKKYGSCFLLLYGPSGCGKLTTLKVLCNESGINLVEWAPQVALTTFNKEEVSDIMYTSEISLFEDFVLRATRYSNVLSRNSCRVIVVKDIPSQYLRDTSLFQSFLTKYSNVNDVNLVFIVSDYKISRELFSEDVKRTFNIKTIQFNPVTQRNTLIALQNIAKGKYTEYLHSISLSSCGDLRNAITTLQFLSVKGTLPLKKKHPFEANTKTEAVDLFHSIGRILYAKKEENGKLKYSPTSIVDSFTSSPNSFLNMLQENYLETFSSIHEIAKASDSLSESDTLLKTLDCPSLSLLSLCLASQALMIHNSNPTKKFQQFNRPVRVTDQLFEYKSVSKCRDSLIDIISYGRLLPSFSTSHKEIFSKIKPFGKGYCDI